MTTESAAGTESGPEAGPGHGDAGRPEAPDGPDGYDLPDLEHPLGDAARHRFLEDAREMGLTPRQAERAYEREVALLTERADATQAEVLAQREAAAGTLHREWGGAYEENLAFATRAALAFGGEDLITALDEAGLGDEPVVLRALAAIGRATAEHRGIGRGGGFDGPSPGAARAELRALYADPAFTADLSDKARPGHDAAYDRWSRLVDAAGG